MMALAEFEREQTSERTREATAARAERGLWNGGRLLGYDLDSQRKGHLVPNEEEATLVNYAFDAYLQCGSLAETAKAMNRRGYRTKAYASRRGKQHAGKEFTMTSVQYLLKNPAYIGNKEINKKARGQPGNASRYHLVEAVWPAIVDEEKFRQVQSLMAANGRTNHNGCRPVRHAHVLSGLLECGRCGSVMQGRSGTGHLGARYYYYVCRGPDCGLRVVAEEVEGAILGRVRELAASDGLLERLVDETNRRVSRQKPALSARRRSLQKSLDGVRAQADKALAEWSALEEHAGRAFLTEKLGEPAQRRSDLERGVAEADEALQRVERDQVTAETVRSALSEASRVYACLTPFEQKELMRLVLHRAEVSERQILLELHAVPAPTLVMAQGLSRSEPPNWYPRQDSNLQPPD